MDFEIIIEDWNAIFRGAKTAHVFNASSDVKPGWFLEFTRPVKHPGNSRPILNGRGFDLLKAGTMRVTAVETVTVADAMGRAKEFGNMLPPFAYIARMLGVPAAELKLSDDCIMATVACKLTR